MRTIDISTVVVADAESLLKIYEPYVRDTAVSFEYEVPSLEEFSERISNISAKYPYLKAVDQDGNIIGYAYANVFKAREAYKRAVETTIYLNKDYRRQNIGRMLYEELEKRLVDMGICNMNACIGMPAEGHVDERVTEDSFKFHEKMGFSLAGRFHKVGYKFGNWYDMIWMEKIIAEHK